MRFGRRASVAVDRLSSAPSCSPFRIRTEEREGAPPARPPQSLQTRPTTPPGSDSARRRSRSSTESRSTAVSLGKRKASSPLHHDHRRRLSDVMLPDGRSPRERFPSTESFIRGEHQDTSLHEDFWTRMKTPQASLPATAVVTSESPSPEAFEPAPRPPTSFPDPSDHLYTRSQSSLLLPPLPQQPTTLAE